MKRFKHAQIIGKRWFQKSYGTTYHSVTIIIDGKQEVYIPFKYGYGDQYKQTAGKWLKENGYMPKNIKASCQEVRQIIDWIIQGKMQTLIFDVDRKKDL